MATPDELKKLYGELRAALLSRHFALGRYFRANLLSLGNNLGIWHGSGPRIPDRDDLTLPCDPELVRPSTAFNGTYKYIYSHSKDLLAQDKAIQLKERWRITYHGRENPLMDTGLLLICLAVEHVLGRSESIKVIREALASLASLYKFKGDHFDGYILRYDPVTSDSWVTTEKNRKSIPKYCCEFLIDVDGNNNYRYLYCTPLNHPRYDPRIEGEEGYDEGRHKTYRRWEPSMDELVGLIMGYDIVFRLVDDQGIRDEVRRQVRNLGDYLAEHGYLLVRPCGGFTARGASGSLPAFEFPFGRVFERITGDPFPSRIGFEGALGKAGVWDCLSGPLTWGTVLGIAGGALLAFLGGTPWGAILLGVLGAIAGFVIGRAAAVYFSGGCFDVWDNSARGEFSLAYLLKILSLKIRFQTWFRFAHWFGGPAAEFPPKIGLTGLDDSDTTVRDSYIGWFQRKRPWGCFANAVAVVLGAGVNAEKALADRLQRNYNEFDAKRQRTLFVTDEKDYWEELKEPWGYFPTGIPWPKSIEDAEGNFRIWYHNNEQRLYFRGRMTEQERDELLLVSTNSLYQKAVNGLFAQSQKEGYVVEWHGAALSYMTCLALAWMHTKRRKDAGSPIPPEIGLPDPPDLSSPLSLPPAAVPQMVIDAAQNSIITLPLDAIQRDLASGPGAPDADLFKDPAPPSKPKEDPPPQPKEHVPQLIIDKTVTVKESDGDVDTGIDIQEFDIVEIEATGEIWAGVWFTGKNDADGWNGIDHDKKFPLHTGSFARPFCLLGKWGEKIIVPGLISVTYWKGDYFFVGKKESPLLGKKSFKTVYIGPSRGLILRTNDDTPGNGSGEFSCHIQVWR